MLSVACMKYSLPGVCRGVRVCAHTQRCPACTSLTPKCPVSKPVVLPVERKPRCQAWTTGEGPALVPWGLLFVQPVPRHLSPAGLFSSLATGGEFPFEAQQIWNPRGRDAWTLAFLPQARLLRCG